MKTFVGLLATVLFLTSSSVNASRFEASVDAGYASSYVPAMSGGTVFGRPVTQQSISVADRTGLYAQVLSTIVLVGDLTGRQGREIDLAVGWNKDVSNFNFDVGYARYYPKILDLYGDDGKKIHAAREFNVVYFSTTFPELWKIKPYLFTEADMEADRSIKAVSPSFLYQAGLKPEFGSEGLKTTFDLSWGGNINPVTINFLRIGASVTFTPWKKLEITPQVNLRHMVGDPGYELENKMWYGIDFKLSIL